MVVQTTEKMNKAAQYISNLENS